MVCIMKSQAITFFLGHLSSPYIYTNNGTCESKHAYKKAILTTKEDYLLQERNRTPIMFVKVNMCAVDQGKIVLTLVKRN
jgi:hypothetical protein